MANRGVATDWTWSFVGAAYLVTAEKSSDVDPATAKSSVKGWPAGTEFVIDAFF